MSDIQFQFAEMGKGQTQLLQEWSVDRPYMGFIDLDGKHYTEGQHVSPKEFGDKLRCRVRRIKPARQIVAP